MNAERKPVYDPQQLEPLLISRQHAGDIEGMTALFEPMPSFPERIAKQDPRRHGARPRKTIKITGAYRRSAYTLAMLSPATGNAMSSSRRRVMRAKPVKAFLASSADMLPDSAAEQQFKAHW